MNPPEYPVFIRPGDARAEVDRILAELKAVHGSAGAAGFHKYLYVTKADQTVVFVTDRNAPLATALRGRPGWQEPSEKA